MLIIESVADDKDQANVKDGLIQKKPLNANNDRPLFQVDRNNQWSDYSTIRSYEKGIPGNEATLP